MCNQHTGASRARPEPLTRCRTQFSQSEWPSKKLLIPMAGSVGQARCPARPSAETQGNSSQSPRPTPTELAVVRPEAKCPPGPCRAPTPSPQRGIKAGFTGESAGQVRGGQCQDPPSGPGNTTPTKNAPRETGGPATPTQSLLGEVPLSPLLQGWWLRRDPTSRFPFPFCGGLASPGLRDSTFPSPRLLVQASCPPGD